MSDFARLAGQQCPPQEALALELALTSSLSASALLLALPVDESSRAAQSASHQRLLSRLN